MFEKLSNIKKREIGYYLLFIFSVALIPLLSLVEVWIFNTEGVFTLLTISIFGIVIIPAFIIGAVASGNPHGMNETVFYTVIAFEATLILAGLSLLWIMFRIILNRTKKSTANV